MVKISIGDKEAVIENFKWTCDDEHLQDILNIISKDSTCNSQSEPEPDLAEAQRICSKYKNLNAQIIEKAENPRWKREDNKIY